MAHIVTLDSRQEAALQAVAEKFVATHKGDVMKALKEMIVLNDHLQEKLDAAVRPSFVRAGWWGEESGP